MTDERPNPDIFFTDEEVEEMKDKGIITEGMPDISNKCCVCHKPIDNESRICDECIPF
jgi:hypothetical protein